MNINFFMLVIFINSEFLAFSSLFLLLNFHFQPSTAISHFYIFFRDRKSSKVTTNRVNDDENCELILVIIIFNLMLLPILVVAGSYTQSRHFLVTPIVPATNVHLPPWKWEARRVERAEKLHFYFFLLPRPHTALLCHYITPALRLA